MYERGHDRSVMSPKTRMWVIRLSESAPQTLSHLRLKPTASVLFCSFWFHSSEPIVRNGEMKSRTCTQARFAAACHRRCEIATRHKTRRNLNPSGEYGVVDERRTELPTSPVQKATKGDHVKELKRFVLSSVLKLKQVGRLRVPLQTLSEHTRGNLTHFIAGESVLLSPRFLVAVQEKLWHDHVLNVGDSLIPQILYR